MIDAAFANFRSKIAQEDCFGREWQYTREIFASIYHCWRNLGSPLSHKSKQQTKQWNGTSNITSKAAKIVLTANKIMATIFWVSKGTLRRLESSGVIIAVNFKVVRVIKWRKNDLILGRILFYHDNAFTHLSVITLAKINDMKFVFFLLPAYSLGFVSSNYYVFPNLKIWFVSKKFVSNEKIIIVVICNMKGSTNFISTIILLFWLTRFLVCLSGWNFGNRF